MRFFDQIRFFPVPEQELLEMREAFPLGRYPLRIEETSFNLRDYQQYLDDNAASIDAFRATQRQAFQEERERWEAQGLLRFDTDADAGGSDTELAPIPDGCIEIVSPVAGSLWQLTVRDGEQIAAGQTVAIVESMKMEIAVDAAVSGRVRELSTTPGTQLQPGRRLLVIEAS